MACSGPVLIVVGIVLFATNPNAIDDYNKQVSEYNGQEFMGTYSPYLTFPRYVQQKDELHELSYYTQAKDPVQGSLDGIKRVGVSKIVTANVRLRGDSPLRFVYSGQEVVVNVPPERRSHQTPAYCLNSYTCTMNHMREMCQARHGATARYVGTHGRCGLNEQCGVCEFQTERLHTICIVTLASTGFGRRAGGRDNRYRSCFYPFGDQDHKYIADNSSAPFVEVQVRSSNDPFLVLQRVTEGTNNFGDMKSRQTNIGIACVVVGAVLAVVSLILGCVTYRRIKSVRQSSRQHNGMEKTTARQQDNANEPIQKDAPQNVPYPMSSFVPEYQAGELAFGTTLQQGYIDDPSIAQEGFSPAFVVSMNHPAEVVVGVPASQTQQRGLINGRPVVGCLLCARCNDELQSKGSAVSDQRKVKASKCCHQS